MSGKRRGISVKTSASANSDINVTPLIDVVLVLLIIFMVVTPLLEKDIEVRVPETEKIDQPDVDVPDQLVVEVTKEGDLNINSQKVPQAEYVDRLTTLVRKKPKGQKIVFFVADEQSPYGRIVNALDGARQAGAEVLGMKTEPNEPAPAGGAPTPPTAP